MINPKLTDGKSTLFNYQKKQSFIFLSILFMLVIICVTCGFTVKKEVNIYIDTNNPESSDPVRKITVSAPLLSDVEAVLKQADIKVSDDEYVDTSLNKAIKDVDEIHVTQKIEGLLFVDGERILYQTAGNTVSDVLREYKISLDADDEVTPAKDTVLTTDNNQIHVVRVETRIEGREQEVDFGSDEQENAELSVDTRNVISEGIKGVDALVEKVTYKDGAAASREVLFQARISNPVNEVVEVGTLLPGGGNISTGNSTMDPGEEMDFICAVVAQEGGHSYEGALAVISCIMNRVDRSGSDAVSVITAPGQFSGYLDGDYLKYLGDDLPEVRQAVTDCMENGIRSHDCYSFRGYYVDGAIQIGGNYYF